MEQTNFVVAQPAPPPAQQEGRIQFKGSVLHNATSGDSKAIETIFRQFMPAEETISHVEYYGYFGFWFVGFHSFSCLSDKRLASLQVGPFKKIRYQDVFYEDVSSGGVYQPSKFWLYVFLVLGMLIGFAFFTFGLYFLFRFILVDTFRLYELAYDLIIDSNTLWIVCGLASLFLLPFIGNFITMAFYRANPCGVACWIRQKMFVAVFVSRKKMLRANQLYRMYSSLREARKRNLAVS